MQNLMQRGGGSQQCSLSRRSFLAVAGLGLVGCALGASHSFVSQDAEAAEVDISFDEEASLFCGGNMSVVGCIESEGIAVCLGDFLYDYTPEIMVVRQFSARVAWGLYSVVRPDADALVVGGNYTFTGHNVLCHTGNVRIGGNMNRPNNGEVAIITEANYDRWTAAGLNDVTMPMECWLYKHIPAEIPNWEPYADEPTRRRYQDLQNRATIQTNLGRATALKAKGGKTLKSIDYATYLDDVVRPASKRLFALDATGDVTYSKVGDFTMQYTNASQVRSTKDMWITLTGDGVSKLQVFHVDAADIIEALNRLSCVNVSVDMVDIPEDASVVVNVHGNYAQPWHGGFRTRWNGTYRETYVNEGTGAAGFKAYVKAASALMWNFPETSLLALDPADGEIVNQPGVVTNGALFPGSFLVPYGSVRINGCTNGHVACSGDMRLEIWEHHNVPWRGSLVGFAGLEKMPKHSNWL